MIALGLESPENHLLLLDDLQGRRTAERLNLRVTGTLGVVLEAKRAGLLQRVAPTLELLRGTNMWISDRLIRMVLKQAGEA